MMTEIAYTTDEQSTGIHQIAQAVNELDLVIQQNTKMVEQATAEAMKMEDNAQQLSNMVAHIRLNEKTNTDAIKNKHLLNYLLNYHDKKRKKEERDHINSEAGWETFYVKSCILT